MYDDFTTRYIKNIYLPYMGRHERPFENSRCLTGFDVRIIWYLWRARVMTQRSMAKLYKVSSQTINNIIRGRTWKQYAQDVARGVR